MFFQSYLALSRSVAGTVVGDCTIPPCCVNEFKALLAMPWEVDRGWEVQVLSNSLRVHRGFIQLEIHFHAQRFDDKVASRLREVVVLCGRSPGDNRGSGPG